MTETARPRVLVAEDDPTAREIILGVVASSDLESLEAVDGVEALEKASEADLVLLDMNLPRLGGLDVCRRLRSQGHRVPIIMVTAMTDTVDAVVALEVGADDYVRKPFHARELAARVATHLRGRERTSAPAAVTELEFPGLSIDTAKRRVRREGEEVELTITEFDLLRVLAENPEVVVTRRQLMQRVWRQDVADSRTIDAHIYRLRRKIEPEGATPMYIHNVARVGYRFAVHTLHPTSARATA